MKVTHFVINHDECIALIYQSEKLGKVVVFRTSKIDIEFPIEIHSSDTYENDKKDIMDSIMELIKEVLSK